MQENQRSDSLSHTLKELRLAHGYKQADIAGAIGIQQATYSNYEIGNRTPNTMTLYRIANFYGMSVDDLLKMSHPLDKEIYYDAPALTSKAQKQSDFIKYINDAKPKRLTREEKELLYHFSKLSPAERKEVLEFARFKNRQRIDCDS